MIIWVIDSESYGSLGANSGETVGNQGVGEPQTPIPTPEEDKRIKQLESNLKTSQNRINSLNSQLAQQNAKAREYEDLLNKIRRGQVWSVNIWLVQDRLARERKNINSTNSQLSREKENYNKIEAELKELKAKFGID